jgi:PAS domain S-box-containing protein
MNTKDLFQNENEISNTSINIETLESLKDNLENAQSNRDYYLLSGNSSYLQPFQNLSESIDTIYSKLKIAIADKPNQKFYFDTLTMLVRERFQLMNRSIELQNKHGNNSRQLEPVLSQGRDLQTNILRLIGRMKDEEKKLLHDKINVSNSKANFTIIAVAAGTFFSIVLLVIAFTLLDRGNKNNLFDRSSENMSPEELEEIIKGRTQEISEINKKLYAEIDKHKEMEKIIRKSAQEYKMLFEQAHDAILIFEAGSMIVVDVNNRACEVYGISYKDFIGLSLKTLTKNLHDEELHIKKTLEKGFYYNFQSVHYKREGTEMLMEINASVIYFKGQRAVLSINRDITERILALIPLPGS